MSSHKKFRAKSEGKKSLPGPRKQDKFLLTLKGLCWAPHIMIKSPRIREVDSISSTESKK